MRLTNAQRDQITEKAINARFEPIRAQNEQEEFRLAKLVYAQHVRSSDLAMVKALPAVWHHTITNMAVNAAGQRHWLSFPEPVIAPPNISWVIEEGPLAEAIFKWALSVEETKAKRREATRAVKGMLNQISTFAILQKEWPEGQEFYRDILQSDKRHVPAVTTRTVNQVLGLAK